MSNFFDLSGHQRRRLIKTVIKARLKHIRAQGNMCFQRRARSRFAIRYVSPRVRPGAMWGTGIFYWAFDDCVEAVSNEKVAS